MTNRIDREIIHKYYGEYEEADSSKISDDESWDDNILHEFSQL